MDNLSEYPLIESLDYRGYHLDFYLDDYGQCFFTIIDGEEINFGSYNDCYIEDAKYLIDNKLDTITRFDKFPGAKLIWFDNAGHWDIELLYRMRALNIWLIKDRDTLPASTIDKIIIEAKNKLESYLQK